MKYMKLLPQFSFSKGSSPHDGFVLIVFPYTWVVLVPYIITMNYVLRGTLVTAQVCLKQGVIKYDQSQYLPNIQINSGASVACKFLPT